MNQNGAKSKINAVLVKQQIFQLLKKKKINGIKKKKYLQIDEK